MRRLLGASFILFATVSSIASQEPPRPSVAVAIGPVGQKWTAAVGLQRNEIYVGGPWAEARAMPLAPGTKVTASGFRVRTWKEGDVARVVVYAVMIDDRAPQSQTETPISTFTLTLGQSVEVRETGDWGAAHVAVSAIAAPSRP
jgi:hypothetical protein